jgi:hypothetical protein
MTQAVKTLPCARCGVVHDGFAAHMVEAKGPSMCLALAKARVRYERAKLREVRRRLGKRWWSR